MPGTALIHLPRKEYLFSTYVMLPDGSVRPPMGRQDWLFWENMSRLLGWRKIGHDVVGDMMISTVFLGFDHDHMMGHTIVQRGPTIEDIEFIPPLHYKPLIFETMVFGGVMDGFQRRYRALRQAKFGHKRTVLKARWAWAELSEDHDHDVADGPVL